MSEVKEQREVGTQGPEAVADFLTAATGHPITAANVRHALATARPADEDGVVDLLVQDGQPPKGSRYADAIKVLGPEHDECVVGYTLLRNELVKRTAERDSIRGELRIEESNVEFVEGQRDTARELADHAVGLLEEVLGGFHEKGHPGEPCRRTGWVAETTLAQWAAQARSWRRSVSEWAVVPTGTAPSPGPRVWKKGDPEPTDCRVVRTVTGELLRLRASEILPTKQWWRDSTNSWAPWEAWLNIQGPLTEAIQDGSNPDGEADA